MTSTTKEIFERYEVRKTRKQKLAFIQWLKPVVQHCGYCMNVEKGSFGSRNIIIGDPEKAKVIFSAHYDTCAVMPFPNLITPKNIWLYILYQLVITAAIFIIVFGITFLVSWIAADAAMPSLYASKSLSTSSSK